MKKSFKIEDFRNTPAARLNPHLFGEQPERTEINKHLAAQKKKGSKYKAWMTLNIGYWCKERGLEMKKEYKFNPFRKFAFDWCIPDMRLGIEYEGIMADISRHSSVMGLTKDTEKYNLAAADGWTVLRYTAINHNYKNVIEDLNKIYGTNFL